MTKETLRTEIEKAVPMLLDLARQSSWNKISGNCKFILSEIKDSEENFHVQRQAIKKENDRKTPVSIDELMPILQQLYENFYDINLHIYRSNPELTIVDIRYYPKSSLDENYRQKVINDAPMLHCKVAVPPWIVGSERKFNINWEHYPLLITWNYYLQRLKLKFQRR